MMMIMMMRMMMMMMMTRMMMMMMMAKMMRMRILLDGVMMTDFFGQNSAGSPAFPKSHCHCPG